MGFTQSSQGGKDAMFFRHEGAKAESTTKAFLYFRNENFPLWGTEGAHEFTNCLTRRSRENRVCAEIYEKDTAFARS